MSFFNPTIEVVTFRLRGWYMLGVFSLPAFTRRRHECQDLLSSSDGMRAHRLGLGLYSHPKEFWGNGVRTHVNSKGKNPSTGNDSPQRRLERTKLHQTGQRAQHTTNELFRPQCQSYDSTGIQTPSHPPWTPLSLSKRPGLHGSDSS